MKHNPCWIIVNDGGTVDILQGGKRVTLTNETLCRNGWNAIADAVRLLEGKPVGYQGWGRGLPMKGD